MIHDARMHADMRHMFLNHQDFAFDDVFDDNADNDAVYGGTGHDLILAAVENGIGTVLMFGQTGSGKTFKMNAIYVCVTVSFIELLGNQLFDMLNGGVPCQCMTGTDGAAFPYPWSIRLANELKFSVPVCSSHVKRVLTRSDCADLDRQKPAEYTSSSFQNVMKCDVDICVNSCVSAMLPSGTALFQRNFKEHDLRNTRLLLSRTS